MTNRTTKIQNIKRLEYHLRNYQTYEVGIRNLKRQLDYIMPDITANYELAQGSSGTFNIRSDTEKYAIDRIESKKALDLHESIRRYELIISAIDESMNGLEEIEREFIKCRYFKNMSFAKTAQELTSSEKHIYNVRNVTFNKLLISLRGILDIE